ncbi:MAG: NlpC/P60 family protein [bacterium]
MIRTKKLLALLLAIAACAGLFLMPADAAGNLKYGAATVSATSLNIRSGPSTDSSRLTAVIGGTRLLVLDRGDEEWFHVNFQGTVGYVKAEYLKEINTVENFKAAGTITASDVRLRKKPNTSADILATYNEGMEVQVIGINEGWFKVQVDGLTGYIRSDLMDVTGAPDDYETTDNEGNEYSTSVGQQVANLALKYLGYSYIYGEESPSKGFDCSGLVYYCYGQYGYTLERRASLQYKNDGTSVKKENLRVGDLVFFSSNGSSVTHVGIYIGDGQFVHASNSNTGVIISELSSAYYTRCYWGAKRIA